MSVEVFLLIVALVALGIGLSKGGLGGAFGGVITPLVTLVIPVKIAVAMMLPLFIVGDWIAIGSYYRDSDRNLVRWTLPPALVGVIAGTYLLANLPGTTLRHLLGVLALVIGFYKFIEPRLQRFRYQPRRWHGWLAGALSGMGSAIANAGGPSYSGYLLLQGLAPRTFIATTAIFFTVVNLSRLPGLVMAGLFKWENLLIVVWFVPLVWLGVRLGEQLITIINRHVFDRIMTVILVIAGVILVL